MNEIELLIRLTKNGFRKGFIVEVDVKLIGKKSFASYQPTIKLLKKIKDEGLDYSIIKEEKKYIIVICTQEELKEYIRLKKKYETENGKYYKIFYMIGYNTNPYERINFFNLSDEVNPSIWKNVIFDIEIHKKTVLKFTNVYGTDIHDNDVNGINQKIKDLTEYINSINPNVSININISYFSYYKGLNLLREKRRYATSLGNNVLQQIGKKFPDLINFSFCDNPNAYPSQIAEKLASAGNMDDAYKRIISISPSCTYDVLNTFSIKDLGNIIPNPNFTLELYFQSKDLPTLEKLTKYFTTNPNINLQNFNLFKDLVFNPENPFFDSDAYDSILQNNKNNINLDIQLFESIVKHFNQNDVKEIVYDSKDIEDVKDAENDENNGDDGDAEDDEEEMKKVLNDRFENIPYHYFSFNPNCTQEYIERKPNFITVGMTTTNVSLEFIINNDLCLYGEETYKSELPYYLQGYGCNPNCTMEMIRDSIEGKLVYTRKNGDEVFVTFEPEMVVLNPNLTISNIIELFNKGLELPETPYGLCTNPNFELDDIESICSLYKKPYTQKDVCTFALKNIFTYNDTVYEKIKSNIVRDVINIRKNLMKYLDNDSSIITLSNLNIEKVMLDLCIVNIKKKLRMQEELNNYLIKDLSNLVLDYSKTDNEEF